MTETQCSCNGKCFGEIGIIHIFQCIFFIGLSVLAMFFMKEVLNQYASNDTSMKQNDVPIFEIPAVTICFKDHKDYQYGIDLNITVGDAILDLYERNSSYTNELYSALNENMRGIVKLEKTYCYVDSEDCYKVTRPNDQKYDRIPMQFSIYVKFDQSIPYEDLPDIEVFFTSEDNADGIIFKEWMEGIELSQDFDKVLFYIHD